MSVIIKAGSEICKANTNTSTAKYQYTIPKAARFPEPKVNPKRTGTYQFYSLPSTLSKRYTKFGYGTKSDFTRGDKNYVPKLYDRGSDFDKRNPHGPKYSFANGREKYGKVFLETAKPFDKNVPGPGKYNILKEFGSDAPKVSFKGKYDNVETRKKKMEAEAEAEAKANEDKSGQKKFSSVTIQIRPTGKYYVSQIPNVNSLKFDKDKSQRTKFIANKNPGPGTYEAKSLMGRNFPSQFRSYEPISIAARHNVKDSRSNYPGPGSYPIPSDFGQYQSKYADQYPKENVYVEPKKKDEDPKPWRHGMKKIKPKPQVEENYEDNNEDNNYNGDNHENEEDNHENEDNNNAMQEQENKNEEKTPEDKEENKGDDKKEEDKKEEDKNEDKKEEKAEDEQKEEELEFLRNILQYKNNETPGEQ